MQYSLFYFGLFTGAWDLHHFFPWDSPSLQSSLSFYCRHHWCLWKLTFVHNETFNVSVLLLTYSCTIFFLLHYIVMWIFASLFKIQKLSKKVQTSLANANIVAEETVSSLKTVRSFANEEGERKSYWNKLRITYLLRKKEAVAYGFFSVISSVSWIVGTLCWWRICKMKFVMRTSANDGSGWSMHINRTMKQVIFWKWYNS